MPFRWRKSVVVIPYVLKYNAAASAGKARGLQSSGSWTVGILGVATYNTRNGQYRVNTPGPGWWESSTRAQRRKRRAAPPARPTTARPDRVRPGRACVPAVLRSAPEGGRRLAGRGPRPRPMPRLREPPAPLPGRGGSVPEVPPGGAEEARTRRGCGRGRPAGAATGRGPRQAPTPSHAPSTPSSRPWPRSRRLDQQRRPGGPDRAAERRREPQPGGAHPGRASCGTLRAPDAEGPLPVPQPRRDVPAPLRGPPVTGLARRLAVAVPTEPASPPAWRGHPDARLVEVLGAGRLTAAIDLRDDAAVDRLVDVLLEDAYLGPRLAGRVWTAMGDAIASGATSREG
jgi:hypothetical protein